MGKIKFFALAALMATSLSVSAQTSSVTNTKGWSTFWFQWSPSKTKSDIAEFNKISYTGISLGYSRAFGVSKSLPLFVEGGLGVQYSFDKETNLQTSSDTQKLYRTDKYRVLSAKVPVNLMYKWDIPYSKFSLLPYVGVNLRFNILSKKYIEETGIENGAVAHTAKTHVDCFDDDEVVDTWDRFQVGWEIGVKAVYDNKYQIGISWGRDFNDFARDTKSRSTNITLGYMF